MKQGQASAFSYPDQIADAAQQEVVLTVLLAFPSCSGEVSEG